MLLLVPEPLRYLDALVFGPVALFWNVLSADYDLNYVIMNAIISIPLEKGLKMIGKHFLFRTN